MTDLSSHMKPMMTRITVSQKQKPIKATLCDVLDAV
jgi:hypothetical protein